MRLILRPNDRPEYGKPGSSLSVTLPGQEKAIMEWVDEGSWRLIIYSPDRVVNRGLFGSPYDILTLLEAEYSSQPYEQAD